MTMRRREKEEEVQGGEGTRRRRDLEIQHLKQSNTTPPIQQSISGNSRLVIVEIGTAGLDSGDVTTIGCCNYSVRVSSSVSSKYKFIT